MKSTFFDLEQARSELWSLDPDITHLNHGSFGACPTEIIEHQQELQRLMEFNTVHFFERLLPPMLDEARIALAEFVGAQAETVALVPNATTAVNTVLAGFDYDPGDEVLVTDHGYNACSNAARYYAERMGASVNTVSLPFPISSSGEVVERVLAACTEKTRLVLIDHVTSPTGLVLPVDILIPELHHRGIEVLVDGAHAPGMLPLNLEELKPDYYTGNCHKWLCAPKGTAFLYVREDHKDKVHPITISHGMNMPLDGTTRFRLEFDWTGTDDATGFLCIAPSIQFLERQFEGGMKVLMERNRALALQARRMLCEALEVVAPCPEDMVGTLAAVILPVSDGFVPAPFDVDPLRETLAREYRIEVPVMQWSTPGGRFLRASAQLYNSLDDYRHLAKALCEEFPKS